MPPKKIEKIVLKKPLKQTAPKSIPKETPKPDVIPSESTPVEKIPKKSSIPQLVTPEHPEPNIHNFLHVEKNILRMEVHLPKIPLKCIVVDMLKDKFTIDSLKFSKKYYVNKPYHGGVEVDPESVTAEFDGSILKLTCKVTNIPQETKEKESKVVEARRKGRDIKFEAPVAKRIVEEEKKTAKKQAKKQRQRENVEFPNKKKKLQ